jgi:hypothetical protein
LKRGREREGGLVGIEVEQLQDLGEERRGEMKSEGEGEGEMVMEEGEEEEETKWEEREGKNGRKV